MILLQVAQVCIGIFILGILVLIHELGHFIAAKSFHVRVLSFSIGFGKVLLRKRIGDTEYRLSAVPVGGYVHMAGEQANDRRQDLPDEFPSKPVWQRAVIAIAGPLANFISSLFFIYLALVIGVEKPRYLDLPVIGWVADSSYAQTVGIRPGDVVRSINAAPVSSWNDIEQAFSKIQSSYTIAIERNNMRLSFSVPSPLPKNGSVPKQPTAGLEPAMPAVVGMVTKNSPAQKAGLQKGDSIIVINAAPVYSWLQLTATTSRYDSAVGPLHITVLRNGARQEFDIVPRYSDKDRRFLMGIAVAAPPTKIVKTDIISAIPLCFKQSWDMVVSIFDVIGKLVSREVSPRQLAGPVGIVQMSGGIAFMGLVHMLSFLAFIGINLALLNLLPLIITDGGMLLFLLVEFFRGRPLPVKYQLIINNIAIAFFILLFVYVTFNDIGRIPEIFRMTR
jgi:regulator of sigma E protease